MRFILALILMYLPFMAMAQDDPLLTQHQTLITIEAETGPGDSFITFDQALSAEQSTVLISDDVLSSPPDRLSGSFKVLPSNIYSLRCWGADFATYNFLKPSPLFPPGLERTTAETLMNTGLQRTYLHRYKRTNVHLYNLT